MVSVIFFERKYLVVIKMIFFGNVYLLEKFRYLHFFSFGYVPKGQLNSFWVYNH